ncbi:MAG TPA: IPT/TIG domain-containing protein [Pyrinomonadaceae bacterium]|jgi:hypothetical protein
MALFEGKTPAERNKMIAAIVLPLLALIFVFQMFSGPSKPNNASPTPTPRGKSTPRANGQQAASARPDATEELVSSTTPISCCPEPYVGGDAGRNIFAFYVKPPPPPAPVVTPPTPTPPPPPPYTLGALAPQSVFARTAGFALQVTGDKFGPAARVYIDNQEVPTQYKSMQQLSANVPASLISSPGQRSVVVRTPDGQFFSNQATINVMQPPAPTYTFVGFLKRQRQSANTAVLKDGKGELYSVRQGDLVEGRFRVTEISERGVEVVDKDLNIKHTMPFVDARGIPGAPPGRAPGAIQPPPPDPEGDDEP